MPIEPKLDRNLLILYLAILVLAGLLLMRKIVTWDQVVAFMSGAIVVPGFLGKKKGK